MILTYLLILSLFIIIIFFTVRTAIVAFSMSTEVPFLPSSKLYKEAIKHLEIEKGDKVLDIGSGDGRVLIYAAKRYPEAEFVGIERNALLVGYSKLLKLIFGLSNLTFHNIKAEEFDITRFNKIYIYLLPEFSDKILMNKIDEIKSGTVILSFHFPFGSKFIAINNPAKYPVKYGNRRDNIYKYIHK
jgi:SAM-dependent methyltransferase